MTAGVAPAIQVRSYKVGTYRLLHCDHQSSDLMLFYHFITKEVNMIEIKGFDKVQTKLKNLQNLNKNTKPLIKTLGLILQNEIEDSFENEKSPFGKAWTPLAKSTLDKKKKSAKSDRILRNEGNLADRWITKADKDKATVSNNIKSKGFAYGLSHQFGTNKAGRSRNVKIPARPFLPVDADGKLPSCTKDTIKDEVINYVIKNI